DFPVAAATASRMWTTTYGGTVDGVIAIDPVVVSGLLDATGPVTLPSGDQISSANAVKLLLSDVYQRYSDPDQQDAFFASAAGSAVCRADGKPSSVVAVTLTNRAAADAGSTLPRYVTGGGIFGVTPGHIKTRVAVYGPSGGLLAATRSGGGDYPTVAGVDASR